MSFVPEHSTVTKLVLLKNLSTVSLSYQTISTITKKKKKKEFRLLTSNCGAAVGLQSTNIESFPLSGAEELGLPSSA